MNKKIASEIAIGIILFLAVILGIIFWLQREEVKNNLDSTSLRKNNEREEVKNNSNPPSPRENNEDGFVYLLRYPGEESLQWMGDFYLTDLNGNKTSLWGNMDVTNIASIDIAKANKKAVYLYYNDYIQPEIRTITNDKDNLKVNTIVTSDEMEGFPGEVLISRDGTKIFYDVNDLSNHTIRIFTIDFDGKNKKMLADISEQKNQGNCVLKDKSYQPKFLSKDGKIFIRVYGDLGENQRGQCLLSVDSLTGEIKNLNLPLYWSEFSYDEVGNKIFFTTENNNWSSIGKKSPDDANWGVYVLNLNLNEIKKLVKPDGDYGVKDIIVSSSGEKVAFQTFSLKKGVLEDSVNIVNIVSGEVKKIVTVKDLALKGYIGDIIIYQDYKFSQNKSGYFKVRDDGNENLMLDKDSLNKNYTVDFFPQLYNKSINLTTN